MNFLVHPIAEENLVKSRKELRVNKLFMQKSWERNPKICLLYLEIFRLYITTYMV